MPNVGEILSKYNRIYVWVQPDASKGPGTWRVSNPDEIAGGIPSPEGITYEFTAQAPMMVDVSPLDQNNTITVTVSMDFINLSDRQLNSRTASEYSSFPEYPINPSTTSTSINYQFNAEEPAVVNRLNLIASKTSIVMWSSNFLNLLFKDPSRNASSLSRKFQTKSGSDNIYEFVGEGPINVDTSLGTEANEELVTTSMNFAKLTERNA